MHNYANADRVNGQVEDSDTNIPFGGICGDLVNASEPAKLSVDALRTELTCGACTFPLLQPISMPTGHTFCSPYATLRLAKPQTSSVATELRHRPMP